MTTPVVAKWTGRRIHALQTALRMTNEAFADHLGTAVRTVAKWNANPTLIPLPELQRALDTVLAQAPEDAQIRFGMLDAPKRCPHRITTTHRSVRRYGLAASR
jgi:hypothetical protein